MSTFTAILDAFQFPNSHAKGNVPVRTPIDGSVIGTVDFPSAHDIQEQIAQSQNAFLTWRLVPAPRRGELIRLFGAELRTQKEPLGKLISLSSGKILQEGLGEVQEMIDICDFAVGLSRQLYGLTIASERPNHRMMETWHPIGPVGVISAFNFPAAVWAWNFALAIVCGNSVLWKSSEKTPLVAQACQKLFARACRQWGDVPQGLSAVILGDRTAGMLLAESTALPLISATGSTAMGRQLAPVVAARLGRSLLELGGNNAMILAPSANVDLATRAIVFSAVGTAGQRCTSLRRLIVHRSLSNLVSDKLTQAYQSIRVGDPLAAGNLVGPLIDEAAFTRMQAALQQASKDGGRIRCGGERLLADKFPQAFYVKPALIEMPAQTALVQEETFAPLLYLLTYDEFEEAIHLHNSVSQGLSSSIFTNDVREAERFLAANGSDCGIANVNIGPSGAEIGGAFGGEKATGGGRESGSDAWKNYMRRATNTINYANDLPLAQGISFSL